MDDQKRDDKSTAADERLAHVDKAADDELSDDELSNATGGIRLMNKPDEDAAPDGLHAY
jgi:hypothetical protein